MLVYVAEVLLVKRVACTCAVKLEDAGSQLISDAARVRFELTRLETRTKESKYLRECMLLQISCA